MSLTCEVYIDFYYHEEVNCELGRVVLMPFLVKFTDYIYNGAKLQTCTVDMFLKPFATVPKKTQYVSLVVDQEIR